MKLSSDQKRFIRMALIYIPTYIILYPLMLWIMGKGLSWDSYWQAVLIAVGGVAILLPIYLLGSHVPTRTPDAELPPRTPDDKTGKSEEGQKE
ncbi:MAG: hypothetical protein IKS22_03455 [Bacteroidales bacterium]|nr:hypothetical protein [Bacteroidales bacterium]